MNFVKIKIIPKIGNPVETIMKESAVVAFQEMYGEDRIINLGIVP